MIASILPNKKQVTLLFYTIIILILYSIVIYYNRSGFHNIETVLDSIYFSFTTFLSVGYGDMYPLSNMSKLIIISKYLVMLYFLYL